MQLQWMPARPEPLPGRLIDKVCTAWERACKDFRRTTGRSAREALVYLTPDNKLDWVEVR